ACSSPATWRRPACSSDRDRCRSRGAGLRPAPHPGRCRGGRGTMRAFWVMLVLLTALVAFSPVRAAPVAAEPEKAEAGEQAKGAHEGGAAKDPFAPALDLTIWTSVVFILLFLILRAFAWKPILEGLHKREHAVHDAQDQAKKDRDEAGRLREQLQLE